jgi:hypothetical protein
LAEQLPGLTLANAKDSPLGDVFRFGLFGASGREQAGAWQHADQRVTGGWC